MTLKLELICNICKHILEDPISLPCLSAVCSKHLSDGSIRCLECEKEFDVPQNGFPPNKIVSNILANELYLSDAEKTVKHAIQELIDQLEQLQEDLKEKHSDLEQRSFDHFTEIRRQIDLQREQLKAKIDEIALKLIDETNEKENAYKSKMEKSLLNVTRIDIEQSRQTLLEEFRKPHLLIEEVKQMRNEQEQKVNEFQARIKELGSLCGEIESLIFTPNQSFRDESFGLLKPNGLIAYVSAKKIILWNLASNECVATLEGHTKDIECLEAIDKSRFASGSSDKTIRIWDSKAHACIKTLIGHESTVCSLKSFKSNNLASGSYQDIKIWNVETGKCLQTLHGHSSWIRGIVYLPNGNLVSCSEDKTIKVWDLVSDYLTGHSGPVNCLLLLRNGQLASCSGDRTIKIWNVESG